MGDTKINTKQIISEITDDLVSKGLTNIKEIRIEPFAIGAYIHANVSVNFFETQKIDKISTKPIYPLKYRVFRLIQLDPDIKNFLFRATSDLDFDSVEEAQVRIDQYPVDFDFAILPVYRSSK